MDACMATIKLNVSREDLHYFDKFLSKEIVTPPVDSLRAHGSYNRSSRLYQRKYEILIKKDEKEVVFKIGLSATPDKINPLHISAKLTPSGHKF